MRREGCLAGVNGGYFDEKFAPIGLRIANGQMIAPLQRARLHHRRACRSPLARGANRARPVNFRGAPPVTAAISVRGRLLVIEVKPIGGLNDSTSGPTDLCVDEHGRSRVGRWFVQAFRWQNCRRFLRQHRLPRYLRIERGLNLDGGIASTGFCVRSGKQQRIFNFGTETRRDFVGVVPK